MFVQNSITHLVPYVNRVFIFRACGFNNNKQIYITDFVGFLPEEIGNKIASLRSYVFNLQKFQENKFPTYKA